MYHVKIFHAINFHFLRNNENILTTKKDGSTVFTIMHSNKPLADLHSPNFFHQILEKNKFTKHLPHQTFPLYGCNNSSVTARYVADM